VCEKLVRQLKFFHFLDCKANQAPAWCKSNANGFWHSIFANSTKHNRNRIPLLNGAGDFILGCHVQQMRWLCFNSAIWDDFKARMQQKSAVFVIPRNVQHKSSHFG
jgi:hypothetical protein